MRAITDAGGEHQCFDKLTEYRTAMDPVSSVELPGTESMAWLFDKHPPLATALNMIYAERCLQAKLSAAYMAWTTKDMHADVFLCDGYGKQLEELGAALTDAKHFKDGANEVIPKLRGAADVAKLKDCVELSPRRSARSFVEFSELSSGRQLRAARASARRSPACNLA